MNDDRGSPDEDPLTRFLRADSGPLLFAREVLSSALAVVLVGLLLFAVAGVWPPMVAVESPSMEPNMHPGDLVFITQPDRFAPAFGDGGTGVVSAETGEEREYRSFDGYGSVIIYQTPDRASRGQSPIIHRAHLYVEEDENWYDRADPEYLDGDSCEAIRHCPAPYDGFITKGDNNSEYDQANGIAKPVRGEWVRGVARIRIPYLGWVRLLFSGAATTSSPVPVDVPPAAATASQSSTPGPPIAATPRVPPGPVASAPASAAPPSAGNSTPASA